METAPVGDAPQVYALQPWRALEGTARITAMATASAVDYDDFVDVRSGLAVDDKICTLNTDLPAMQSRLDALEGHSVVTWSGVFDIGWIYASGLRGGKIRWMDAMLLWKTVDNSQLKEMKPAWSLAEGVKRWCLDEPWAADFLIMKAEEHQAGEDDQYWQQRCKMDAYATARIATKCWAALTPKQQKTELIESACIAPVAKSWIRGVRLDVQAAAAKAPIITDEMRAIETKLRVLTVPNLKLKDHRDRTINYYVDGECWQWLPSKVLSSPKQLGELLFGSWGLVPKNFSEKTELPSTDKKALTYLADHDDRIIDILRWRMLNTQYTKFIKGITQCSEYLHSDTCHPQPKIGSTYTRRMTYKSKSGSKGEAAKAKAGIALHQFPRPKTMRKLILPPKGKMLGELDAAGQEMRFMCIYSKDPKLTEIFQSGKDVHSNTGAAIAGMDYDVFMKGLALKNETIAGPHGLRYQGKFTNLSNLYRIGIKTLRIKARVDYGMDVDWNTAKRWQDTIFREYVEIKTYWKEAIFRGREQGYAETLGGRRFGLNFWGNKEMRWATESSAINTPIQGSGADQKELALAVMTRRFPLLEFGFDLHDGLFVYPDAADDYKSTMLEVRDCLDHLPYGDAWGFEPEIPLPWDASVGPSWGELEEL